VDFVQRLLNSLNINQQNNIYYKTEIISNILENEDNTTECSKQKKNIHDNVKLIVYNHTK